MRREDRYLPPACEPAMLCLIALLNVAWGCSSTPIRLAFVAAGIVGLTLLYREYLFLRQEAERQRLYTLPWSPPEMRKAESSERRWKTQVLGRPTFQRRAKSGAEVVAGGVFTPPSAMAPSKTVVSPPAGQQAETRASDRSDRR